MTKSWKDHSGDNETEAKIKENIKWKTDWIKKYVKDKLKAVFNDNLSTMFIGYDDNANSISTENAKFFTDEGLILIQIMTDVTIDHPTCTNLEFLSGASKLSAAGTCELLANLAGDVKQPICPAGEYLENATTAVQGSCISISSDNFSKHNLDNPLHQKVERRKFSDHLKEIRNIHVNK